MEPGACGHRHSNSEYLIEIELTPRGQIILNLTLMELVGGVHALT